jgi:hypothetical protein
LKRAYLSIVFVLTSTFLRAIGLLIIRGRCEPRRSSLDEIPGLLDTDE